MSEINFENIIRWDLVDEDLAKGKDSHILKVLAREDK